MPLFLLNRTLNIVPWLLLLHGAYSCLQFRNLMMENEIVATAAQASAGVGMEGIADGSSSSGILGDDDGVVGPPPDVWIEIIIAFGLLLFGQLTDPSNRLHPCTLSATKRKELAAPVYRTRDFDIYNNRNTVIASIKKQD